MIKKYFSIFLFLLIYGCEYKPIYSTKSYNKINFNVESIEGNNTINSELISSLNQFKTDLGEKILINIKTNYSKKDLSKNSTGSVVLYRININANFEITINNKKNFINMNESTNMNKISNQFDEQNYEKSLKKIMARTLAERLILELSKIQ